MAIDRFKEGMSKYFTKVERSRREQTANSLQAAADCLTSGDLSIDQINSLASSATRDILDVTVVIRSVRADISEFVHRIGTKLKSVGIDLPPVEVLMGVSYELSKPTESSDEVKRALIMKESIKSNLGDLDNFMIPVDPEEQEPNNLGPSIDRLGLSTHTRNVLFRHNIRRIGGILQLSESEFKEDIPRFGPRRQNETLDALYRFGILPGPPIPDIPEPAQVEAPSPVGSPLD